MQNNWYTVIASRKEGGEGETHNSTRKKERRREERRARGNYTVMSLR